MRRVTPLAPLALFVYALLFGCGEVAPVDPVEPSPPPSLIGSWRVDLPQGIVDSWEARGRDLESRWPIMTFLDETRWSTGTKSDPDSHMSGEYVLVDGVVKLDIQRLGGQDVKIEKSFLLSEDGMTLSASLDINGDTETFRREVPESGKT